MADQTEIATVLPKELRLGVPPKMPQGRSYLYRQQSTLASYQYANTVTINIPRLQRSYLRKDSYLRFRATGSWTPATATDSLVLDTCGAFGFFERIEVFDYLGSTLLESISGIPQLASLLLDLGLKQYCETTNGNSTAGLQQNYAACAPFIYGSGKDLRWPGGANVVPANSGAEIVPATGGTSQVFFSREFAIHLPSFLGLLSDKYIPLHNGFTIVLTTAGQKIPFYISQNSTQPALLISTPASTAVNTTTISASAAVDNTTALKWALSEIYLDCQILELGALADSMMMEASQGAPMVVHTKAFRNYVGTVKGASYSGSTYTLTAAAVPSGTASNFTVNWNGITRTITTTGALPTAAIIQAAINSSFGLLGGSPVITVSGTTLTFTSASAFTIVDTSGTLGFTAGATNTATGPTLTSTGQAEFVLNMNLNVASLTDVLWMMRSSTQIDNLLYASAGNRTRNFLQRWMFQYGSATLPQSNGIQTMSPNAPTQIGQDAIANPSRATQYMFMQAGCTEGYQELMKSRPVTLSASRITEIAYSYDFKFNGNVDPRGFTENIQVGNLVGVFPCMFGTFPIGRFACGLNLQLANNKEGQIISGLNTNGMNTSIRGIFHPLYTDCMDSVRVDAWAEYDAFINISPGIATTVSF